MIISNSRKEIVQIGQFKIKELLKESSSRTLYRVLSPSQSEHYLLLFHNLSEGLAFMKESDIAQMRLYSRKVMDKFLVILNRIDIGHAII